MKIGIAASKKQYYGQNDRLRVSTHELKDMCQLFIDAGHEVYILTETDFLEPKHDKVTYDPHSEHGEIDFLFTITPSTNLLMNRETFRVYHVLSKWEYKKSYEIIIDTNIGDTLASRKTHRNFQKQTTDRLVNKMPGMGKWLGCMEIRDDCYFLKLPEGQTHEPIYNASSQYEKTFPWTLFGIHHIFKWNVERPLIKIHKNVYIGNLKLKRLQRMNEIGVLTDLYSPKFDERLDNMNHCGAIKMKGITSVLPAYTASVITADHEHKSAGWILRRIWESLQCKVPVLIHEDLTNGVYGFTDVSKFKWFSLTDEEIVEEFGRCVDDDYRDNLLSEQIDASGKILKDFEDKKVEEINKFLTI